MVIPSSPSPTPTLALALNSKLSSPESLLEYARSLLRTKDTPSLAILLFLLDALTFLHSASKSDSASDSEDRVGGESSSQFPSSSSSSTPATAEETWEEWSDYISEVYSHPSGDDDTTTSSHWRSPLAIDPHHLSLAPLLAHSEFNGPTRSLLLSACTSALSFLSGQPHPSTSSSSEDQILQAILSHPSLLPAARPPSILRTISSTLSSQRRRSSSGTSGPTTSSEPHCPSTRTFRWTIATVLEHFFGEAFRPHQSSTLTRQGEWVYAQCEEDDLAIKRMCEVGAREEEDQVEEEEEEEEEELDQESGIRAATLSIARRDDKMRWVFGNDFQKSLPPTWQRDGSPTPPSKKRSSVGRLSHAMGFHHHHHGGGGSSTHHDVETLGSTVDWTPSSNNKSSKSGRRRPVSMGSFDSHAFSSSASSSSISHDLNQHRRVTSTSSSTSPLMEPPSPPPPTTISPRSPPSSTHHPQQHQHRRGVSTSQLTPTPTAPFINLLAESSNSSDPTSTSTHPPSRRVSLDSSSAATRLPPTTNTLSPQDRKELWKRSRKLEQLFGVPMEEEAVREVLLKGHQQQQQQQHQSGDSSGSADLAISTSTHHHHRPLSLSLGRSRSFTHTHDLPLLDPASADSPSSHPSLSLTMTRSHSHPGHHSTPSPTSPSFPSNSSIHNPSSYSAIGGTPSLQKEERRRRMMKLQRWLGEKVPAELALREVPGRAASSSGGGKSGGAGGRFGGMFKGAAREFGSRLGGGGGGGTAVGGHHQHLEHKKEEKYIVVEKQDFDAAAGGGGGGGGGTSATTTTMMMMSGKSARNKVHGAVGHMARARKLENVFGDLPPKALYMSHQEARHDSDRRNSDASSSASSSLTLQRTRTIDSFRNSIVSLQHLAENDPEALEEAIVEVYAAAASSTPVVAPGSASRGSLGEHETSTTNGAGWAAEGDIAPAAIKTDPSERVDSEVDRRAACAPIHDEGPTTIPPLSERSSTSSTSSSSSTTHPQARGTATTTSSSHRRTSRRATKLADRLGTTRGEVWSILLDDLQSAIEEEETLDEEERREVLGGVERLREGFAA